MAFSSYWAVWARIVIAGRSTEPRARALQILDLPDAASRGYTFSTYMTLTDYDLRLTPGISGPFFLTAWSRRSWEMNLVSGRVKVNTGKASRNGLGVGEGFAIPRLGVQKGPHASSALLRGGNDVHKFNTSR